jgi:formate-dependent nitrite reductase membrane component NrfD
MAFPEQDLDAETANSETAPLSPEERRKRALLIVGLVALVIAGISGLLLFVSWLLRPETPTATIRDIMIVFFGIELAIMSIAAIILIYQIARLINMLQNEVRPVLDSANATMNTLRGTAAFLGDNLVRPVVKINSYLAGARRLLNMFNPGRKL